MTRRETTVSVPKANCVRRAAYLAPLAAVAVFGLAGCRDVARSIGYEPIRSEAPATPSATPRSQHSPHPKASADPSEPVHELPSIHTFPETKPAPNKLAVCHTVGKTAFCDIKQDGTIALKIRGRILDEHAVEEGEHQPIGLEDMPYSTLECASYPVVFKKAGDNTYQPSPVGRIGTCGNQGPIFQPM